MCELFLRVGTLRVNTTDPNRTRCIRGEFEQRVTKRLR
jgi:hypothetical protein